MQRFNRAIDEAKKVPSLPSIAQLARLLAPLIRDQLQATGIAPLNLQSLLPSSASGAIFIEDTHANRLLAPYTPPTQLGAAYLETDRNVVYTTELVSGSLVWVYTAGTYVSTFANRPADLGTNDTGFLFYATDQSTIYIWTGAAFDTITRRILIGGFFAIFTHANTADRTYTFPNATDTIVLLTFTQTLTNKQIGDPSDPTKTIAFTLSGATTGKTLTLISAHTDNRSITFPNDTGTLVYDSTALTANNLILGAGTSKVAPLGSLGTTTTFLQGNAGGAPTWANVDLATSVTGTLPAANGGTGVTYNRVADTVALTAQTADISATPFANSSVAGTYRCSYYLEDTTADLTAGTVQLTVAFTDAAGSTTVVSAALVLTAVGRTPGVFFIQLSSGSITYAVAHTGIFGTAQYALYACLERLS